MLKSLGIDRLYFILVILFILHIHPVGGQGIIKGRVFDRSNEPIPFANVFLSTKIDKAVATNAIGYFEIEMKETECQDFLVISYLGCKNQIIPLTQAVFRDTLNVFLEQNQNMLQEVVLTANTSQTKEFSVKELDRISIYMHPASYGDALKAIAFLPYSTNTSENANPELRGSSGDYSRVVLNSVPIYNPVRNSQLNGMGNFSLLNTELIAELFVYAGNPPLTYGNSLAGLVEINTAVNLNENRTKIVLSLANIGMLYSHKINKKSFIQAYMNYQFPDWYIPLNKKSLRNVGRFNTTDFGLNYRCELSPNTSINLYSYAVKEDYVANSYTYNYFGEMTGKKKRNFNVFNFLYRKESFSFSINNGTNFSESKYNFGNIKSNQTEQQIYTSIDSRFFFNVPLTLQTGFSHDYFDERFKNTLPYYFYSIAPLDSTYSFSHKKYNHNLEYYMYGKYQFSNLIVSTAFRKNVPTDGQTNYLSYQSSLRYNYKQNSLILSGGNYNGYTVPGYFVQDFSRISSSQVSLEYLYTNDEMNVSTSIFQKFENTPVYFQEDGQSYATNIEIRGAELSMDYTFSNFKWYGACTYLNSRFNNTRGWFRMYNSLNYFLKLSASYYNQKFVNATISYSQHPGLFYTPISSSDFNDAAHNFKPIYADYNSKKMTRYSSLDLSLNRVCTINDSQVILFGTLTNMFNKKNREKLIYSKDYSSIVDYWLFQERLIYIGVQFQFGH